MYINKKKIFDIYFFYLIFALYDNIYISSKYMLLLKFIHTYYYIDTII